MKLNISKSATKRVKDPLPVPTCNCFGKIELVNNSEIYGREYGKWPYAYLCRGCLSYVGLHPFTDIPLGILANAELRESKKRNKSYFDKI